MTTMRHITILGLVLASSAFFHWLAIAQPASDPETPVGPRWWPGPGDAVLINTGHGFWWKRDNKKFQEGEPGIGLTAGKWLSERNVTLVGSDNWAVDVAPPQDPDRPFEGHQWRLTRHWISLLE